MLSTTSRIVDLPRLCLFTLVSIIPLIAFSVSAQCPTLYQHSMNKLNSSEQYDLCQQLDDRVVLMVNTASQCGFTPQFKALEALYQKYKAEGLVVIGFPSNDFRQDTGSEADTANVCYRNYGVTFPMMAKSSVKGESANPIYKTLLAQSGKNVSWNFQKYLVNKRGEVVEVFSSGVSPMSNNLTQAIEKALQQ